VDTSGVRQYQIALTQQIDKRVISDN